MANTTDSFDLSTAVLVDSDLPPVKTTAKPVTGFDLSTATPISDDSVKPDKPKQEQPTDIGRQVALGGRAAAQGVVGALTLPGTLMAGARNLPAYIANNWFGGKYPYTPTPVGGLSAILTKLGAPNPQTSGENLASAGISGVTG